MSDMSTDIPVQVCQFPPRVVLSRRYQMSRVLFTKQVKGIFVATLLDVTVAGQVSTRETLFNKPLLAENGEGTGVIVYAEVDLCEPKCV